MSRTGEATTLVFNQGSKGFFLTTAKAPEIDSEKERIAQSYPVFMNRNGIREFISLNQEGVGVYEVVFGNKRFTIINNTDVPESKSRNVDYLIIGSGYKGNIIELVNAVKCDTVLLGSDIHGRRRHRYFDELTRCGQKVRDLGETYGLVIRE